MLIKKTSMSINEKLELTEKNYRQNSLFTLILLAITIFGMICIVSCNSKKKALKPYYKVLNDVDPKFKSDKDLIGAKYCVNNFSKKETKKDSIVVYVPMPIEDLSKYDSIKDAAILFAKSKFKDSFYSKNQVDSITRIAIDFFKKNHKIECPPCTSKNTTTETENTARMLLLKNDLLFAESNLNECKLELNECKLESQLKAKSISQLKIENELLKKAQPFSYHIKMAGKIFLQDYWWLMILLVGGFIGYKFLKQKYTLPKIF
jgi:hypothetical protein